MVLGSILNLTDYPGYSTVLSTIEYNRMPGIK